MGNSPDKSGFDAPLMSIKDDCFDHARIARSIHSLVMGTPSDWSVRVGVYSEWGSGKTTVCRFIEELLDKEKAAWIWFNPWQYSSKDEMYIAFVATLYKVLSDEFGYDLPDGFKWKTWFGKGQDFVGTALSAWNEHAGKLAGQGMSLLNQFVCVGLKDAEILAKKIRDRRIVVFIDDLDRTDPKLVPELLFALREIMDIPGFAFLCAFDPHVVGKVLGEYHSGFGDGLAFLDKIIDYPVWLPSPTEEQLVKMAMRDIDKHSPFVSVEAFQDILPMLPQNPRSIRQFVRMLTMLNTQIGRHHVEELNWHLILGSNAVRVRYPRFSNYLLCSDFWQELRTAQYKSDSKDKNKTKEEMVKLIVSNSLCDEKEVEKIADVLVVFYNAASNWLPLDEYREYHFRIAEGPAAVTWKEFDAFADVWRNNPTRESICSWVSGHAGGIARTQKDVYGELFATAINKRQQCMSKGVDCYESADAQENYKKTDLYFELMRCMTADLSAADWFGVKQLELLASAFNQYVHFTNTPTHADFRRQEKEFFDDLLGRLPGDLIPYIEVIKEKLRFGTNTFFKEALDGLSDRLSLQIIARFHQKHFIQDMMRVTDRNNSHVKRLLFDPNSPVWSKYRRESLSELKKAPQSPELRKNAVDLFMWMDREPYQNEEYPRYILSDMDIIRAWFAVLIAKPLEPRTIGSMRDTFNFIDPDGTVFDYPEWWIKV